MYFWILSVCALADKKLRARTCMVFKKRVIVTKFIATIFAASMVLISWAVSQESLHSNSLPGSQSAQDDAHTKMEDSVRVSSPEDLAVHQDQMNEMQDLMEQARATTDPEEWTRLMSRHSEMMKERVTVMMGEGHAQMVQHCDDRMTMMQDLTSQMTLHHGLQRPNANDE
jgi:hypothetical protein